MKPILFIFLLGCFPFAKAQQLSCWIRVQDAETGRTLNRASIAVDGLTAGYTNDSGVVALGIVLPATIRVSFVGYQMYTLHLKRIKQDTLEVLLVPDKQQLSEVSVFPKLPDGVYFGSYETQVIDYAFVDSYTLIAVYHYKQRKCYLLILDAASRILAEEPLPSDFDHFYESCIHKYYAVSGSVIQEVQFKKGFIHLAYVNDDFFYNKVLYYKGFYKEYFYIMSPHKSKQAHLYYVENTTSKQILPFAAVGNQHTFNKYLTDEAIKGRKRNADLKAMGLSTDEDAVTGYYEKETRGEFIKGSEMEILYQPVESKLFVKDSTVLLFDFTDGWLNRYTSDGTLQDSVPFSFHKTGGWQPFLERNEGVYYTSYIDKDSTVTLVTIPDSIELKVEHRQKLKYPGVFQWKVHNGFVYYLYYTLTYPNIQFLCREKLQ